MKRWKDFSNGKGIKNYQCRSNEVLGNGVTEYRCDGITEQVAVETGQLRETVDILPALKDGGSPNSLGIGYQQKPSEDGLTTSPSRVDAPTRKMLMQR